MPPGSEVGSPAAEEKGNVDGEKDAGEGEMEKVRSER